MAEGRSKVLGASKHVALQSNDDCATPAGAPDADTLITGWRSGASGAPRGALVKVLGHGGAAVMTGPCYGVGYHDVDAVWYRFAMLNGGADISVTETVGWLWEIGDVPAWASSIRVEAAAMASGTVDVEGEPISTLGGF